MAELVKVTVTPQGTADVWIGELHIKTFGGKVAHQAACDFAQQIKNEIASTYQPIGASAGCGPVPEHFVLGNQVVSTGTGDKADDYKFETQGNDSVSTKRSRHW